MKHLKNIGVAAVAAAVLLSIIASSASADVICTTNTDPCNTPITSLEASIEGSLSLKDTSNNEFATCTVGSVKGSITAQGKGVNPSGPISSLTWGSSGAGCNITVDTVANGSLELRTSGTEKQVWAKSSEVTLVAFGVSCTYGAAATGTKVGTLNTGAGATMTINAVVNKTAGSFLCPSTSRWSGAYKVTNHSSVFVANEASPPSPGDVICTTNTDPCNTPITSLEASIEGSLSLKDTSNNEFMTCTVGSLAADITAQGKEGNPSGPITSLTWGSSGAGCNTTVDTVKNGKLELKTEAGVPQIWGKETEFTLVTFSTSCTYGFGTGTALGRFTTGTPGTLDVNAVINKTAGTFICPSTARWSGSYKVTNHSSVFVSSE